MRKMHLLSGTLYRFGQISDSTMKNEYIGY